MVLVEGPCPRGHLVAGGASAGGIYWGFHCGVWQRRSCEALEVFLFDEALQGNWHHPELTAHPLLLTPPAEGKIYICEGFSLEEKGAMGDVSGSK